MISKKKVTTLIVVSIFLGLMVSNKSLAAADSTNPGIYAPDARPFGLSYGEWAAKWWQWLNSIPQGPQGSSPVKDKTGQDCGQKQSGPVWFLAGTYGGDEVVKRVCSVPLGKAIFAPIISSACDDLTFPAYRNNLTACAKIDNEGAIVEASIDGYNVIELEKYRVQSPVSSVTNPNPSDFGNVEGKSKFAIDGFWLFLEPLDPGTHTIYIDGQTPANPQNPENPGFRTAVNYTLTIR